MNVLACSTQVAPQVFTFNYDKFNILDIMAFSCPQVFEEVVEKGLIKNNYEAHQTAICSFMKIYCREVMKLPEFDQGLQHVQFEQFTNDDLVNKFIKLGFMGSMNE